MGSAEPRSFSRGNRGIAGTLIFSVFDRDALLTAFEDEFNEKNIKIQKFAANNREAVMETYTSNKTGFVSIEDWDDMMSGLVNKSTESNNATNSSSVVGQFTPHYADEILPFDITLTFNKIITKCA